MALVQKHAVKACEAVELTSITETESMRHASTKEIAGRVFAVACVRIVRNVVQVCFKPEANYEANHVFSSMVMTS